MGAAASGQGVPSLSQIVSNVANATRPTEAYAATVTQTLSPPDTNVMAATMAPGTEIKAMIQTTNVQTFEATFDHPRRKWVSNPAPAPAAKSQVQVENAAKPPLGQPSVRLTVNLEPVLESMLSSNQLAIAQASLNGRSCYRIDGQVGQQSAATLWVDAGRWYISRATINLMNHKFADVACEYRQVNGRWLPSKTTIDFALDGTHAELDFGEYKLRAAK